MRLLLLVITLFLSLQMSIRDFINTDWFQTFDYRECIFSKDRIWPKNFVDCLMFDDQGGPSDFDKSIVPEPEGLYYKHLSPGGITMFDTGNSLVPGLKDRQVWSVSLMVHPWAEDFQLKDKTMEERVEEFYWPFVTTMVGHYVPLEEVIRLYDAALNFCDGQVGTKYDANTHWVVVQKWDYHQDCNIHVVGK